MAGSTNSASAMPILRSTHSIVSTLPVSTAKRGMWPWAWVLGSVKFPASLLDPHGVIASVNERCHLPSWTTSVRLELLGTFSVKLPSMPVNVETYAGGEVHPHAAGLTPVCGVGGAPMGT